MAALNLFRLLSSPTVLSVCVFKYGFHGQNVSRETIVGLHFFSHLHGGLSNLPGSFRFHSIMFPSHAFLSCSLRTRQKELTAENRAGDKS